MLFNRVAFNIEKKVLERGIFLFGECIVYKKGKGTHGKYDATPWLDDSQFLVLACGGQKGAVAVERHAVDDVAVAVDHFHSLALANIPEEDLQ